MNCSCICAHALAEERSEGEKEPVYERLERTYKLCPSHDIQIILNNKNAKVGKEIWTGTAAGTLSQTKIHRSDISYVPLRQ